MGCGSACAVHDPVAGKSGGSRCQRMSHVAGISRHADQPGDLSVGRYAPCGNLRHDRIDFRVESFGKGHVGGVLEFALLEALGVFRYDQMVDAVLDVAVHEGRQVVDRVVDAVVGDAPLRVVVGTDLGRTVARRNHRLALRGDFVEVFRIFEVEDAGAKFFESLVEVLEPAISGPGIARRYRSGCASGGSPSRSY